MTNHVRITAYHPTEDLSVIVDSNGMFEKLWQFSFFLVQKGFQILEVGDETKYTDINIDKAEPDTEHILLRASAKGKPNCIEEIKDGKPYKIIDIIGKRYIP